MTSSTLNKLTIAALAIATFVSMAQIAETTLAHRGTGRMNAGETIAFRASGRFNNNLAYRATGRFDTVAVYRGSERDINTVG